MKIESVNNQLVKDISKLKDKKYRTAKKMFIAEGERVIKTFLENRWEPVYYFCSNLNPLLEEHIQLTEKVMQKLSSADNASGHLAVFRIPEYDLDITSGLVTAQINDPGNLGTLLRSTAAFGFKTAILVESCDPWSPKVVQASAGALTQLKIYNLSWMQLVKELEYSTLNLVALVADKGDSLEKIPENSLLVVGNEANGIPQEWIKSCKYKLTIPMKNNIESLNAAVAGSIALYLMSTN